MKVLMTGVDQSTGGGMWTVAENYIKNRKFRTETNLKYIPASVSGSIPKRLFFTAKAYLAIFAELAGGGYDIVHIHMSERGSVYRKAAVMLLAHLFRCRILLHMHGAEFEDWYSRSGPLNRRLVRKIINQADKVVILGRYWMDFIGSLLHDKSKLSVVYNAVDVPETNPYDPTAKNLLFLGVAGLRKGILDLLEALREADDVLDEDTVLWICGPDEIGIEDKIRRMGLSRRAKYKGWVNAEEKSAVFKTCAVNILPSYHEGLPMTILETMAHGIPNIASGVAAVPEAVTEENGALISPGDIPGLKDALIAFSSDQNLRLEKSRHAYETVKTEFSLEKHVSGILKLYRELEQMK